MQLISSMCIILSNGHKDTLKMCYPSSLTYMYDLTSYSWDALTLSYSVQKTQGNLRPVLQKRYDLQCMHVYSVCMRAPSNTLKDILYPNRCLLIIGKYT